MYIDFTISIKGSVDYAARLQMDAIPTVGSMVCFPCSVEGVEHPSGYYFKVVEVLYYPLTQKKECYEKAQNEYTDVQVVLDGSSYKDIKPLVSNKNAFNYRWRKIDKGDEEQ